MTNPDIERKAAANMAKILTAMCVRNTTLEDMHAGIVPITHTGDYSDVRIIDANGTELSWDQASKINNADMKILMKTIVDRLYTFFVQGEDPRFEQTVDYYRRCTLQWDEPEPEIDHTLKRKT
jgi:hypothetical protein